MLTFAIVGTCIICRVKCILIVYSRLCYEQRAFLLPCVPFLPTRFDGEWGAVKIHEGPGIAAEASRIPPPSGGGLGWRCEERYARLHSLDIGVTSTAAREPQTLNVEKTT